MTSIEDIEKINEHVLCVVWLHNLPGITTGFFLLGTNSEIGRVLAFLLFLKKNIGLSFFSEMFYHHSSNLSQFGCCIWENKYSSNIEIEQGTELLLEPNLVWLVLSL